MSGAISCYHNYEHSVANVYTVFALTDGVGVDLYHAPSISVNIVLLDCNNENNFSVDNTYLRFLMII